ncbi:hypothetical protein ACEPAF_7970 [Sanghuangporus sanghuang]
MTRYPAAADVLSVLVASGYEVVTTEIVLGWIGLNLQENASDPRGEDSLKREDRSVYLLTAVTTLGATAQVRCSILPETETDIEEYRDARCSAPTPTMSESINDEDFHSMSTTTDNEFSGDDDTEDTDSI